MEKIFDYGEAKFKVILSDEVVIDPNTNKRCQFTMNTFTLDEVDNTTFAFTMYNMDIDKVVLARAVAGAVNCQYQAVVHKKRPNESISSNDYFWSIETLLAVSATLFGDLKDWILELGLNFK